MNKSYSYKKFIHSNTYSGSHESSKILITNPKDSLNNYLPKILLCELQNIIVIGTVNFWRAYYNYYTQQLNSETNSSILCARKIHDMIFYVYLITKNFDYSTEMIRNCFDTQFTNFSLMKSEIIEKVLLY